MGAKGKSRLRNRRGGVAPPPHANAGGQATAKTGSWEKVAHNVAELAKAPAEPDNAQQRDDGEVVLPQEPDLHGATDEKAAQPADDGPGELEREAPGSSEVVLPDEVEEPGLHRATEEKAEDVPVKIQGEAPGSGEVVLPDEVDEPGLHRAAEGKAEDVPVEIEGEAPGSGEVVIPEKVEEPGLHGATAEEVVRPATEEADDVPVELVLEPLEDQGGEATDAPHAEDELPDDAIAEEDHNVVHPEEVVSLRRRLAAARAANLLNPETVAELNKLFKEMGLSAADPSGSGTESEQLPAAAAGRGRGKQQKKKGKAPAAAGAGRAAKPLMTAAAGGKPDAEQAHERDAAVAWKGQGRR